jgi:hypothetical protein
MTRPRVLSYIYAMSIASALGSGCGRAYPTEQDGRISHGALAGMFVEAVRWPDTLLVGERGTAEIELLLADSTPLIPDYVYWAVDSVQVAELYPTRAQEAKRVRAVRPGRALVGARVYVYRPHDGERFYWVDFKREVFVLPSP